MKTHIKISLLLAFMLLIQSGVWAQFYNNSPLYTNAGGLVSDWSMQGINDAGGAYSTAGSTGAPNMFGVFEHRGQSGTGTNFGAGGAAFINNGSYNASVNGRDYFLGTSGGAGQQAIAGTTAPLFGELFIQNGSGQLFDITNTNGIQVNTSARFENGITTTVRTNPTAGAFKFLNGATYTSSLATGATDYFPGTANVLDAQHVNGYVSKTGNQAFIFPVGSGTDYRPLSISAPASATDAFATAWIVGDPTTTPDPTNGGALHPVTTVASPLAKVTTAGQWDWVDVNNTGNGVTTTVSIPDLSNFAPKSYLRLAGWDGTQWVNLSATPNATGNAENSTVSGTMLSGIQAVSVGSTVAGFPDLRPTSKIGGPTFTAASGTSKDLVVEVNEILGNPTDAKTQTIDVLVNKSSNFIYAFDPTATTANAPGPITVNNADWDLVSNGSSSLLFRLKPNLDIAANGISRFSVNLTVKPTAAPGQVNVNINVLFGSGAEKRTDNDQAIRILSIQ